MSLLLLNVGLALLWAILTGVFSLANLLMGFSIGFLVLFVLKRVLPQSSYYQKLLPYLLEFTAYFIWELLLANLKVAREVLTPRNRMKPRVLAVPLEPNTNAGLTLLANLITLTPGSVSLDVSSDRKVLYIHAMHASDPELVRRAIKTGFERRVLRLMRGVEGTGHDL